MRLRQPASSHSMHLGPPWWRTRYWSMTTWLIVITSIIYVADVLSGNRLTTLGALSGRGIIRVQVWRLLTFQFLHASPIHILFNMLWFYFLGPLVESRMGKRRFLGFYLLCGVAGGAAFLFQWWLRQYFQGFNSTLVGASAGIFGVMAAAVILAPEVSMRIFFLPISIKLWVVFWIMVAIAVLTSFTGGFNAGGEASHLGGAAMGFLLVKRVHWLNVADRGKGTKFWRPGDPASSFFRKDV
jgi:membrane associated rhomboid family serine protease